MKYVDIIQVRVTVRSHENDNQPINSIRRTKSPDYIHRVFRWIGQGNRAWAKRPGSCSTPELQRGFFGRFRRCFRLHQSGTKRRLFNAAMSHGGTRKGAGRKCKDDPRIPLPFRLKTSLVDKAKRLGRDRIEAMIRRAKES